MKPLGRVPFGDVSENRRLSANIMPPLIDCISGEVIANQSGRPMGVAHMSGRISDVYLSVQNCGRDDDAALNFSGEVYINETSCLTTQPVIGQTSGSAGTQKTTRITGDTPIIQAVINTAANSVVAGDVISCDYLIDSEASPDTKLNNPCIVVVFEPTNN